MESLCTENQSWCLKSSMCEILHLNSSMGPVRGLDSVHSDTVIQVKTAKLKAIQHAFISQPPTLV